MFEVWKKVGWTAALSATLAGCCCLGAGLSEEERAALRAEREQREAERAQQRAAEQKARAAEERAKWEALPETQRAFCEALVSHKAAYEAAQNDLKKSKVRRERAAALRGAVPGGKVVGWSGKVQTLTTTGEGNVVLQITLPCDDFTVGTWNNEFSDIMDKTLIPARSPVYDTLAE